MFPLIPPKPRGCLPGTITSYVDVLSNDLQKRKLCERKGKWTEIGSSTGKTHKLKDFKESLSALSSWYCQTIRVDTTVLTMKKGNPSRANTKQAFGIKAKIENGRHLDPVESIHPPNAHSSNAFQKKCEHAVSDVHKNHMKAIALNSTEEDQERLNDEKNDLKENSKIAQA
ncbi:hypothetical protein Tco_1346948 [Tanacetum coccineum]